MINAQYLSIKVKKIEEIIKISKKAPLFILEMLDLFLKILAARLVNLLSERQDIYILLHLFIVFSSNIHDVIKGVVVFLSCYKVDQHIST